MAFSIGDRVVLANGRHDEVYTIRKLNPAKGYRLRTVGGEKYPFWWGDDELASADPIFKVGDRVVVSSVAYGPECEVGEIVNGHADGTFEVQLDSWANGHNGSSDDVKSRDRWYCAPDDLTPIPTPDATIYDASIHTSIFGRVVVGKIYGDGKGRFADGMPIRTSAIVEDLPDNTVRTRNSVYKLVFGPPPGRKFKPGDWVRTRDGEVGIVFHDDGDSEDGDPYRVGTVECGGTGFYSANELVPHLPS
ncbi:MULTISPECIES: hypothetical protein [unclassified Chelatococcus]|uniref:hypothetical protein n=1 Tax=unclassified Chelatococcus TaxID=2638111 RepID=UPI001BD19BC2|nr:MULTISPECIES: hypothetical protein [unclassified Chelatococcus]CAH1665595.1 hypothetical protein CHELA41_22690 [Hyphomicrobiales bacterium]MBS7737741.1 hypothetical protein [Chelatococcus sp. HY11]MBX3547230.1 hypothetical protein [Chelatococcus sp.]MCO5077131.1 hypothetical protein [Chelatococcus sp.]CAH1681236.1 hypothetical protein CHELA20_52230 [Hyphomicrobiales bacterium]